jgi:hypothetical protein
VKEKELYVKNNVKKIGFCLALILSFLVFFACAALPSESVYVPLSRPSETAYPDIILDGAETYIVVWGDTLTKISRSKYRNGFYYPLIMMASNNAVKDQDKIEVGTILVVPKLQANMDDPKAKESMKKFFLEIAVITERKRPRDAAGLRNLANSL